MGGIDDPRFMRFALDEAAASLEHGDVPVGAIVVRDERIIGRGRNQRELLQDPTAHAEILALTSAAAALGRWRLDDCTIYVTLEPCAMCAGALVLARIARLVFAARDSKTGACGSLFSIPNDRRLNHRVAVDEGVLAGPAGDLLSGFFAHQRSLGKK